MSDQSSTNIYKKTPFCKSFRKMQFDKYNLYHYHFIRYFSIQQKLLVYLKLLFILVFDINLYITMYVGYKQEKDNIGDLEDDLTQ